LFAAAALSTGTAHAAPVLGSNVDSTVFSAAIGSTAGWSYTGQSAAAFTGPGTAELRLRSSAYQNSFGFSNTSHGARTTVFGNAAAVGTTAGVTGYAPGYLFYYQADGADSILFSDDNRQYTDGFDEGPFPGEQQGGIDIFFNAMMSKWAFFFDDAGGGSGILGDDNDYNDMVVTFQSAVPEPAPLALLGAGLLGLGLLRRRKNLLAQR
jgi:hypothetical protein